MIIKLKLVFGTINFPHINCTQSGAMFTNDNVMFFINEVFLPFILLNSKCRKVLNIKKIVFL